MRRAPHAIRFLLPIVTALLAVEVAQADPAPQRPVYRADGSVKVGAEVFPTTAAYYASPTFRAIGGRCATPHTPPVAEAAPSDCSLSHTTINSQYDDNRVFVVQVVFHVIKRTDGVGNVTPALIQSQIEILNEDYDALTGTPGENGANAKIQFVLASLDPAGMPTTGIDVVTNNTWFSDPGPGSSNAMKQALKWDTSRYLNIYTNDAAGYLGYATFPQEEAGGPEDGVVVLFDSVGRNSPGGPPYNLGRTATHEVGHYLGLLHTFQDGCSSPSQPYATGDLIADTVPEAQESFGCSPGPSSCGGGANPVENYMDYSDDGCMTNFTVEQANRMRCSIWNFRTINTAPTAAFSAAVDQLDASFTNTSSDAQTAAGQLRYRWAFGDGATSMMASPNHTYATSGTYGVTLTVTDPGSATSTATHQVVATGSGPPDANTRPDANVDQPDADPTRPDADPTQPDAGGNPGMGDGGGCCQTQGGDVSFALCAVPVALVLRRRRRRRA